VTFELQVELAIAVAAKTAAYLLDIGKFAGVGELIGAFNDGGRWLAGIKVKSSKGASAPCHRNYSGVMVSLPMNGDPCPAVPDGHALRAYFQVSRCSKDRTPELSSS
jgi:hypothetical protein